MTEFDLLGAGIEANMLSIGGGSEFCIAIAAHLRANTTSVVCHPHKENDQLPREIETQPCSEPWPATSVE